MVDVFLKEDSTDAQRAELRQLTYTREGVMAAVRSRIGGLSSDPNPCRDGYGGAVLASSE